MGIPKKYKDILDDLIDSLDTKSPDWPNSPNWLGSIDKESCNALRSRSGLSTLLEKDCLDENVLVISLELVPKIQDSKVH